ncbi:HNH endonuclease signature motif containing protein [Occultella kanbiaonis]|uniref:HNH endonuclease signature motif containing protein n=1 Tax=Occultella kanbiaonis TaxID=2675754 RepID=UPI00143CF72F|nr:HNH endonuclease signature motif containing protein [Occultella kanbiaonis]
MSTTVIEAARPNQPDAAPLAVAEPDPPPDPVSERPLEEIEAELSGLAVKIAATTCRFLLLLAEFDARQGWNTGGFASCVNWLSWRCGMSATTAREQVRIAHALSDLPGITAAFTAGHLSYSKVRAITRVATPETEPELLAVAASATANQLERFVAGVRTAYSLADINQRHAERHLRFREEADGSFSFSGRCSPEDAAVLIEEVHRVGDYLKDTDAGHSTDPQPPPWLRESVVHGHALIDALVLICEQSNVAHPGHTDPAVTTTGADHTPRGSRRGETVLHVTLHDLAEARPTADEPAAADPPPLPGLETAGDASAQDETAAPGHDDPSQTDDAGGDSQGVDTDDATDRRELATVTQITTRRDSDAGASAVAPDTAKLIGPHLELGPALHPETARRLTCDTGIVMHVHADGSRFTVVPNARPGRTLDVGRRTRSTNSALKRALWARDHSCRVPGCGRRAYLHAHHIQHWADGGPTTLDNLVLLCSTHHRLLHEGNYDITLRPDGTVLVTTPDGRILPPVPIPHPVRAGQADAADEAPGTSVASGVAAGSTPTAATGTESRATDSGMLGGDASAEASETDWLRDPVHPLTPVNGGPLDLDGAVGVVMGNWELRRQDADEARDAEGEPDDRETDPAAA